MVHRLSVGAALVVRILMVFVGSSGGGMHEGEVVHQISRTVLFSLVSCRDAICINCELLLEVERLVEHWLFQRWKHQFLPLPLIILTPS